MSSASLVLTKFVSVLRKYADFILSSKRITWKSMETSVCNIFRIMAKLYVQNNKTRTGCWRNNYFSKTKVEARIIYHCVRLVVNLDKKKYIYIYKKQKGIQS